MKISEHTLRLSTSLVCGFMGALVALSIFQPPHAKGQNLQELRASELHIVGPNGADQCTILTGNEGPTLKLMGSDNKTEIVMVCRDGHAQFSLNDKSKKCPPLTMYSDGGNSGICSYIGLANGEEPWVSISSGSDPDRLGMIYVGRPWTGHLAAEACKNKATISVDARSHNLTLESAEEKKPTVSIYDRDTKKRAALVFPN